LGLSNPFISQIHLLCSFISALELAPQTLSQINLIKNNNNNASILNEKMRSKKEKIKKNES